MALISLGTKDVSLPYRWVAFNPIMLDNDKFYVLYFVISSPSFEEVYSTFSYRIKGQVENGLASTSEPLGLVEAVPDIQGVKLPIPKYWDKNQPFTVEVKRNIFFSQQSNLADTQVELRIDPSEDYGL